jgi:hypothetical protein
MKQLRIKCCWSKYINIPKCGKDAQRFFKVKYNGVGEFLEPMCGDHYPTTYYYEEITQEEFIVTIIMES